VNSFVNQRIVHHDRLRDDFLAVLDYDQLGPPLLGTAVGVGFLAGAVAANKKREGSLALAAAIVTDGDLAERRALGNVHIAAIAYDAVGDVSGKDEQQAQVHHENGQHGEALPLRK
jgi:hypothetical protein